MYIGAGWQLQSESESTLAVACLLLDSMVIAARACASCSLRDAIGEVGDDWMVGIRRTEGSENSGDVG